MNIGICGGTFDPFHRGHLDPILSVRAELNWERVIYIPAFVQPFKQDRRTESGYHRFAMAALGIEGHDALYLSPRELQRGAVSYTVDTLTELREEHPEATIDWIIGDDNLAALHEWRSIDRITVLANFVVLTRQSAEPAAPEKVPGLTRAAPAERASAGNIVFARNDTVPVSSTEIRMRIREGRSIEDLVPAPVSRYIQHYDLYRKGQS